MPEAAADRETLIARFLAANGWGKAPDRAASLLPDERLDLTLAFAAAPNARTAHLAGRGAWADRLTGLFPDA